ncbi:MAG TPA: hypothetical protein VGH33_20935 [Isosphaeraceae bacterium]
MSTAAAIPAPVAVYHEEQLFGWWVYAMIAAVVAIVCVLTLPRSVADGGHGPSVPVVLIAILALPTALVVGVLRMTTEVTASRVEVWFGWVPTYRRCLDAGAIRRVEVVTYRPLADCGGWGIRTGRDGERVLNARGDRGVRLHMIDGSRLLIGSQTPEMLAASIERAMGPGG